jgi:hypothetical protein
MFLLWLSTKRQVVLYMSSTELVAVNFFKPKPLIDLTPGEKQLRDRKVNEI